MKVRSRSVRCDKIADLLNRSTRLAGVACAPDGMRALRSWRPFSISAFRLVQGLRRADMTFRTVIDVGANIGQFTAAALGTWPDATLIAFEPLPDAAQLLRSHTGQARVELHQVAVGDRDDTTTFHPHPYSLSSSVLPTTTGLRGSWWGRESEPIEVPVRRLDTVLADRALERPVLLKLDVQGFEAAVLDGGRRTLEQVDALVLEVAFTQSYEGQPLFPALHQQLQEAGWRCVEPLDWRLEGSRIVEGDFLYVPNRVVDAASDTLHEGHRDGPEGGERRL